jgi:hypothetical protein
MVIFIADTLLFSRHMRTAQHWKLPSNFVYAIEEMNPLQKDLDMG